MSCAPQEVLNGFPRQLSQKIEMPSQDDALPGRKDAIPTASKHFVSGLPLKGPWPEGLKQIMLGMELFLGCRASVLAGSGRLCDCCGLCWRNDAEPHL